MEKTQFRIDVDAETKQYPLTKSELLQAIDQLRAEILERRGGELIDIDTIINDLRDERDADLCNLR